MSPCNRQIPSPSPPARTPRRTARRVPTSVGLIASPLGVGPWRPNEQGLVVAVAQQRGTGEVLMVAWMDAEALRRTLATGRATYWSGPAVSTG